tara:strand:- start:503 stop:961 length:459 start_codon:yes stop_codon:yes gene_type:complete
MENNYQIENVINDIKNYKKIVFTNGVFDLLHVGHIRYLNEAKSLGHILVVGLNSDNSVKKIKGPSRPINSLEDRALVLLALKSVDYVVSFDDETPLNLIKKVMPDILVKGGDYRIEEIVGHKEVIENGGLVKSLPFYKGYSSTQLINQIEKQ